LNWDNRLSPPRALLRRSSARLRGALPHPSSPAHP
jgi:hypothetical protein